MFGTAPEWKREKGIIAFLRSAPALARGRSACCRRRCRRGRRPLETGLFSRLAASLAVMPVLHTSTTGRPLAGASCLFSGSNWLICTFFDPGMWPLSKSAIGRRSTTSAFSRLIRPVSSAGRSDLKPRNSRANSVYRSATVMPARASDRIGLRPAKACNSSKFTGSGGSGGAGIVAQAAEGGPSRPPRSPAVRWSATRSWSRRRSATARCSAGCVRSWCGG